MDVKQVFKSFSKDQCEWFTWKDGVELLIAPTDNPRYKKEMMKRMTLGDLQVGEDNTVNQVSVQKMLGNFSFEKMHGVSAYGLVFDWKGITEGGKALKFDHAKVEEFLSEDEEFSAWVQSKAQELTVKKAEVENAVVKN